MGELGMLGKASHPHVVLQHPPTSRPSVPAPLTTSWTQHQLSGSPVDPLELSFTFFHPLIICHCVGAGLLLPVPASALPSSSFLLFLAPLLPGTLPASRKGGFGLLAAALALHQVDVGVDEAWSLVGVVGRLLLVYVAGHLQCKQCRGTLHMGRLGTAPEGEKKAVGELERGGG